MDSCDSPINTKQWKKWNNDTNASSERVKKKKKHVNNNVDDEKEQMSGEAKGKGALKTNLRR